MHALDTHAKALSTCFACPKLCRFACPVSSAEGREASTPWGLMTRAEHVRQGRVVLDQDTAQLWEHCTGCMRCQANCKHGVDVAETLIAARAESQHAGLSSLGLRAWAEVSPPDAPVFKALPEGGDVQLLPGHADAASVSAALKLLAAAGVTRIGRPRRGVSTSGERLREAGLTDAWEAERPRVARVLEGVRLLICLEPGDAVSLRALAPDAVRSLPEVLHLHRGGLLPRLRRVVDGPVLYLDDCRLGRGLGVYDAPRELLRPVVGRLEEATMSREQGGCCGAGAGFARTCPTEAAAVAREAVADVPAVPVVIASPVCAAHLRTSLDGRAVYDWSVLLSQAL